MLPATNPLSKLDPVPNPPFPRGLHFPLSLGNRPAQLTEVQKFALRGGSSLWLLADLLLPPPTTLLTYVCSLCPAAHVSRLVPKSIFFDVRETLGTVSILLWL